MTRGRFGGTAMCGAAVAVVTMAGGCGGGLHVGETAVPYSDAATLAGALGCVGYRPAAPAGQANANGICRYEGQPVHVYTFDNDEERNIWLTAARESAGAPGHTTTWFGEGDSWVIAGASPGAVAAATNAAGGQPVTGNG